MTTPATTTLWRPVGAEEWRLIQECGKFPPRLPTQPIFYPVLNFEYACKIASEWNTKDEASGYVGHVVEFDVLTSLFERYEVQTVGAEWAQELWVPAEELDEFNQEIVGELKLVATFTGRENQPG